MKKILITGANSYIGTSFEKWMARWSSDYKIDTLDMKLDRWKEKDFSPYDGVFHVAGIAHVSSDKSKADLYYKVNRDLTIEAAKKAKAEGVKQFIFMSSIIVYQNSKNDNGVITKDTIPKPADFYGDSKLQAEKGIELLSDERFKVAILRPPMIYGKGSRGNYPKLAKFAKKFPAFPDYQNRRSMLHVDNLCQFIKCLSDSGTNGTFFPQNKEYVKTSELVYTIAKVNNKQIKLTKVFNPIIRLLKDRILIINKVFGSLSYDKKMSKFESDYIVHEFEETIKLTEL